jgi:tetratricopeptide (TPR) repeat protein
MQDEQRLRNLAFRIEMPKLVQGRVPETVPYLKELALLLERRGDKAGALAAWEQLHTLWQTDHEATYHRAAILSEQGNKTRALDALREIPLNTAWSEATQRALPLRANLVADAGLWEEMRELMNAATGTVTKTGGPSPLQVRGTIALKEVLVKHQRKVEAMSLLIRAERAAKDEVDRNRLRVEQLKLSSLEPAWTPLQAEARIGALMRMEIFDSEIMRSLVEWMKTESSGPRAKAWVGVLRNHAAKEAMAALTLSVFAKGLNENDALSLGRPWEKTRDPQRAAQLLTIETLLEQGLPALAYQVAIAGSHPQVMESPTMVKVLAALKDRYRMDELFSRKIRQNFPGGGEVVGLAEAFAKAGRIDLAHELYAKRLDHLHATNGAFPQFIESYARFLIGQRRFEQAETLLLKENDGMTAGLPELLVHLYRGWGRLERMGQELTKFQLPIGVEAEAKFLASRPATP